MTGRNRVALLGVAVAIAVVAFLVQGETVRFAARSPSDDEIHVHGYDRSKDAPAGRTVRMSFKATITGIFEIEFEHAGRPIGELKVEP